MKDDVDCSTNGLIQLQGINKFLIQTIGICNLKINFRNTLITHKFYMVKDDIPISSKGILGVDFLSQNNITINYRDNQCFLFQAKDFTKKQLHIPPRFELIIPVYIINDYPFGIIPKTEIAPHVYTAETLICQSNPLVSVINTGEEYLNIDIPEMYLEPYVENESAEIFHIKVDDNRFENLNKKLRLDHLNSKEKEEILRICYNFSDLFYISYST